MTTFFSANDLRKIQYQQQQSFSLTLDTFQEQGFTCTHISRCLPGKRISCQGQWGDKTVFAKFFIAPKRAKIHWKRELEGINLLSQKKICSASILHSGKALHDEIYFVLFEFINNAQPLQEYWDRSNSKVQIEIVSTLMRTIAQHHTLGILQRDLHLNNFILANNNVYTVDGSDIISFDGNNKDKSYNNLAQLFAQLPPSHDKHIEIAINRYAKHRKWSVSNVRLSNLLSQTLKQRNKRKQDYIDKSKRECALFCAQQTWSRLILYSRQYHSANLLQLLASPDTFIENGDFLKRGNSSTVSMVSVDGKKWVIKRYNIKNWRHFLSRAFRPTRAYRSWHYSNLLQFYGINTAPPIAMIEKRCGPIRKTAYFITEYSPGTTYWDFLYQTKAPSDKEKKSVASAISSLLLSLKSLKFSHGDLKISNIMINDEVASLIDLDAMHQHAHQHSFEKAYKKDMTRFFKNWANDPINAKFFNRKQFDFSDES